MARTLTYIAALSICLVCFGCSPVSRHKILSTIFEGVPSLPPAEQLCAEYTDKKIAELRDEAAGKKTAGETGRKQASVHLPYETKKCDDCHDKSKEGGLVRPKKTLCAMCHTDFIKGMWVHGPTAVGECLACHLPHSSTHPKLLKYDMSKLCVTCHKEDRLAMEMHVKVGARGMDCVDCHDPHSGNSSYFLK